jgi:hypothetical protein
LSRVSHVGGAGRCRAWRRLVALRCAGSGWSCAAQAGDGRRGALLWRATGRGVCYCSRRWWAALAPCYVGGRRAVSPSQIVGKLEPPVLLSFPLIYRSTATLLDDKICRRCSIFPQFPVLSAPPSSCGPPRNAVATSHHRNRLRRRLPPRLCPHGHRGSSPWPARFSAPLVILFIVLALLQLHDAHRLHSFTSDAQVTPER